MAMQLRFYSATIAAHLLLAHLNMTGFPTAGNDGRKKNEGLNCTVGLLVACQPFTSGRSTLARVTVYWRSESSGEHASSNGARLREAYCAVDPKKIPYGSKVIFRDATCLAVDTGPDVVNRKAARLSRRNASERNAIVIDRFFDTKQKALAWAKTHPHFIRWKF
jgi:3D (Asp-Asp-Asp) domain-containing protein